MLIVALVLAVIGLAALVTAVVTSNELIAWVCIGASVIGVVLLIVDALRERSRVAPSTDADADDDVQTISPEPLPAEDYPDEAAGAAEDATTNPSTKREPADDPAHDELPPRTSPERT